MRSTRDSFDSFGQFTSLRRGGVFTWLSAFLSFQCRELELNRFFKSGFELAALQHSSNLFSSSLSSRACSARLAASSLACFFSSIGYVPAPTHPPKRLPSNDSKSLSQSCQP